jgi:long-subunit fatty acid transport protein
MIKKIIVSTCLLFSFVSFAQEGTASPYSFFGIGDVRYKGTAEMRSMAGIGIEQDSIHINLDNPASYANLKLTTFSIGGSYTTTQLKTTTESASTQRTTLDYLAVGLPVGKKIGVGFGLIPYSSVGYKIESIAANVTQNSSRFDGKGGLNKVFLGVGYKINPKWSFGADAQYSFGKIETNSLEFITGIPVGTRESNSVAITGVHFNTGLMFQTKLVSKLNFYSSLSYSLESKLQSVTARNISTVLFDANYNMSVVDQADEVSATTNLKIPSTITFGAGIGETRRWLLGAQVSMRSAAGLANSYNSLSNVAYEGSQKYSIGGYFIPNYNSFSSYVKRLVYRGGLKYEKTGLVVNSQSINDIGMTLGIGFPVSGTFSNVNFGFELGKKGTTTSNLVQENYANFSLSLSLNDRWFEKRKFN